MIKTLKILGFIAIILLLTYLLWATYTVNTLPGLSYSPKGLTIFNCDEPRDKNSASVCPKLFCEKSLRDSRKIDKNSISRVTGESRSIHTPIFIIQGIVKRNDTPEQENLHYYCRMEGDRVLESGVMNGKEWVDKLRKGELEI